MRLRIAALTLLLGLVGLGGASAAHAVEPGMVFGQRLGAQNVDQIDRAGRAGSDWIRIYVDWAAAERAPGQLDPAQINDFDRRVGRARAAGMKVLMVVTNSPTWANGTSQTNRPPLQAADYASFIGRYAERFRGRVAAWEVWNEPDGSGFWAPEPDPAGYTELLRAAYPAVKAGDPDATVVLGGLIGNHYRFLEAVYDNGGKGSFDAVGAHTDTGCLVAGPEEEYREADGRIGRYAFTGYREIRRSMLANGDDKPIWLTEMGWATLTSTCREGSVAGQRPSGVSEAKQAEFLTRAYRCLQADPYVRVALWFSVQDVDRQAIQAHRFGLFGDDGKPKPAYGAFRDFARAGSPPTARCGSQVDGTAPKVRILTPGGSQQYLGRLLVSARADDSGGVGVRRMELYADGVKVPGSQGGSRFRLNWIGAERLSLGRHTLTVRARDRAGNVGTASVEVVRSAAGEITVPPARLDFSARRLGGRRLLLSGRVRAPGAPVNVRPKGRVQVFVDVRRGSTWRRYSRFAKGVGRPFKLRYTVPKQGTWRVRAYYEAQAPFASTSVVVRSLGRFR